MYIDFAINNTDINDTEAKSLITALINYPVNSITAPYYSIKSIKNILGNTSIGLSCFIDYPLGISDPKTRLYAAEQATKLNINFIDVAMPQNLACNRKYDKIREDIKGITEICIANKVEPRYIVEYRVFDHHCLKKICEILDENNVKYIFPSTGYFLDNLADNILASIFLHENSKNLNILSTGNIWTDKHFETIGKSGLFGIRTSAISTLQNFIKFNFTHKDK